MEERYDENEFISDDDMNTENMTNNQEEDENTTPESDNVSERGENGQEADWEKKYNDLNDSYLRLHADFDNFRRRTIKEKSELIKTAGEKVIVDLLPVLDDFERALENIKSTSENESTTQGIELIYNKFVSFLLKNGVKKMDVIGQPFDMEKHEALTTIPAESEDMKDKIIDCIQPGYEMGDKVIRFPKVIVAK